MLRRLLEAQLNVAPSDHVFQQWQWRWTPPSNDVVHVRVLPVDMYITVYRNGHLILRGSKESSFEAMGSTLETFIDQLNSTSHDPQVFTVNTMTIRT